MMGAEVRALPWIVEINADLSTFGVDRGMDDDMRIALLLLQTYQI